MHSSSHRNHSAPRNVQDCGKHRQDLPSSTSQTHCARQSACMNAVAKHGNALKCVPKALRTEELCTKALKSAGYNKSYGHDLQQYHFIEFILRYSSRDHVLRPTCDRSTSGGELLGVALPVTNACVPAFRVYGGGVYRLVAVLMSWFIRESIDLMSANTALLPQWYDEFSSECVSRLHVPVESVPFIAKLIRGVVTSLDGVTPRHRDRVIALRTTNLLKSSHRLEITIEKRCRYTVCRIYHVENGSASRRCCCHFVEPRTMTCSLFS